MHLRRGHLPALWAADAFTVGGARRRELPARTARRPRRARGDVPRLRPLQKLSISPGFGFTPPTRDRGLHRLGAHALVRLSLRSLPPPPPTHAPLAPAPNPARHRAPRPQAARWRGHRAGCLCLLLRMGRHALVRRPQRRGLSKAPQLRRDGVAAHHPLDDLQLPRRHDAGVHVVPLRHPLLWRLSAHWDPVPPQPHPRCRGQRAQRASRGGAAVDDSLPRKVAPPCLLDPPSGRRPRG
mmetsp:Transcript_48138/g.151271  ORF Transcript_48138/g.151271 Transcript_48138/m.151271 type:complete len:239 (-) Transcript_48138:252-968(-)